MSAREPELGQFDSATQFSPDRAPRASPAVRIALHCPAAERPALAVALERLGCAVDNDAQIAVIFDTSPSGVNSSLALAKERHVVFVTPNRCPEYRLDLSARCVQPMLFARREVDEIVRAIWQLHINPNQSTPLLESPLSPRERLVLRRVAYGWEDRQIGERLGIKSTVVRNHVSATMTKLRVAHPELRLDSRLRLALYYWGHWQWINRSHPTTINLTSSQ